MVLFFVLIILYFRGNQLEDQVPILNLKKKMPYFSLEHTSPFLGEPLLWEMAG